MSETNLILVISNNQLKVAQSSILGDESKDECKKILDFVQKISNDNLVMKQFQSQLNKCQFIQNNRIVLTGAYKDLLEQNYILSDICGANIFEQILSSKLDTIYLENNIKSLKYLGNNLFIYLVNLDKKQVEIYYQYTVPNLLDTLDPTDLMYKNEQSSVLSSIIKQLVNLDESQDIKLLNMFSFSDISNNSVNQLIDDLYQLID
jgi:hypothetical protein